MTEEQERIPRYMPAAVADQPIAGDEMTVMQYAQSGELNELFAALAEAHLEIQNAEVDQDNDFLDSKYASLAAVMTVCREPLAKQGLTVMQFPLLSAATDVLLETVLAHKSGQYMSSRWSMPVKDNQPQTRGAVLTYLRRYSVSAILGIAQHDDDGMRGQKGPGDYERITPKEADEILMKADELFPEKFGGGAEFVVGRMLEKIFSTSDNIIDRVTDLKAGSAPQALALLENTHTRETKAAEKESVTVVVDDKGAADDKKPPKSAKRPKK